jgi:hypothetical protein
MSALEPQTGSFLEQLLDHDPVLFSDGLRGLTVGKDRNADSSQQIQIRTVPAIRAMAYSAFCPQRSFPSPSWAMTSLGFSFIGGAMLLRPASAETVSYTRIALQV